MTTSLVRALDTNQILVASGIGPEEWPADERAAIEEGLEKFCSAFEAANDRARFARFFAWQECVRSLQGYGALLARRRAGNEDVAPRRTKPTIVIAGLPRTGTTFLHHLIARDSRSEWLTFETALWPALTQRERNANATERLISLDRMVPRFRAIHPMEPGEPDECTPLMQLTLGSFQFPVLFKAPEYLRWLMDEADMKLHYKLLWEHLKACISTETSEFRVLKSPFHSLWLGEVVGRFEDALIVTIDRDVKEVEGSWMKLLGSIRDLDRGELDPEEAALWKGVLARIRDESRPERAGELPLVSLSYEQILDEPLAAIERIYDEIGVSRPTGPIHREMSSFLEASRKAHATRQEKLRANA